MSKIFSLTVIEERNTKEQYLILSGILAFRAEMNLFEHSLGLQASFRIQSFTFWHCTRYRRFKFKTGLPNINDQHILKIKNYGVHSASRKSLLDLFEYRRTATSEGLQGQQTFANINSRMFPNQTSV